MKDENGTTERDVARNLNMNITNPETVDELKRRGWDITEENVYRLVREVLDQMVKEGSMYRDPHGRYYGSEHPVAKAYKKAGY